MDETIADAAMEALYPRPVPVAPRHRAFFVIPHKDIVKVLLGGAYITNVPDGATYDPSWLTERFIDHGAIGIMIEHPSLPLDSNGVTEKIWAKTQPR